MTASIWKGHLIQWMDRSTWSPQITTWIEPYLVDCVADVRKNAHKATEAADYLSESDAKKFFDQLVDYRTAEVIADLAQDIRFAQLRVFHATRVEDAGLFHREGLRPYPRAHLVRHAEQIVAGSRRLQPLLPYVRSVRSGIKRSRDKGTIYTCIDDQSLTADNTHYALYGSEWIIAHLVNLAARVEVGVSPSDVHDALRDRGIPTVLVIDLPLRLLDDDERYKFLSEEVLPSWVWEYLLGHQETLEGYWCPIIRRKIPAAAIVGHYHPRILEDPYYQLIKRSGWPTTCAYCRL